MYSGLVGPGPNKLGGSNSITFLTENGVLVPPNRFFSSTLPPRYNRGKTTVTYDRSQSTAGNTTSLPRTAAARHNPEPKKKIMT